MKRDAITWLNIDRTEGAPVIEVAPRPPKVLRKQKGPGANVFMGNVKFAVVPLRAIWMLIDKPHLMVYLAALGAHAKQSGLCWPSQERLGALIGRHPRNVGRAMLRLEQMGLVKRVKSKSHYLRHAKRRYVIFDEDAKLPADEIEIIPDEYVRFPFNDDPRFRRVDQHRKGEAPMMTLEQRKALTQNEIGTANAAIGRLGRALQAAGERVDRRANELRASILGFAPAAQGHSTATAVRWIRIASRWPRSDDDFLLDPQRVVALEKWMKSELEPTLSSILAHVEVQYREMLGRPAKDSLTLAQLKPPSWVTR